MRAIMKHLHFETHINRIKTNPMCGPKPRSRAAHNGTYACRLVLVGASSSGSYQANTDHSDNDAPLNTQNIREHQDSSENGNGEASD
jgi:hypothetical protein